MGITAMRHAATALAVLVAAPAAAQDAPEFDYPITVSPVGERPAVPRVPSPRQQLTANANQVPIDRAGQLDFTPDAVVLRIADWTGGLPFEARVRMFFDRQGNPLNCGVLTTSSGWAEAPSGWDRAHFVAALCEEFSAKARFTYADWFTMPLERGLLEREVSISRWLTPAEPVRLASRAEGEPVELRVNWQNGTCTIDWMRIQDEGLREDVCAAFLASEEGQRLAARGRDSSRLMVYVPGELGDGGAVSVSPGLVQASTYGTTWPDSDVAEELLLGPDDGRFTAALGLGDIPIGRQAITARVVLQLGIAADGSVATCRPLSSDTFAAIDNATCAALAERGRYEHAGEVDWTGLRYLVQTIRWQGGG